MKYTLRGLRTGRGLTQRQVAKDLGISEQTYRAWERDLSNVAVSKALAVANYYGVELGQLNFLGGKNDE